MAMRAGVDDELKAEINVTPLVDVVLVLLVIFMVVTPLLKQEVPVELPIAESSETVADPGQLTLTIGANGAPRLDGREVPSEALVDELRRIYDARVDKTIFLEADRSVSYGQVVDVMDDCRAAGVTHIGVLTRRPSTPAS
jgi:biopolymer transport protein ExbD